jgi:catechol 2,3-dioxygenase-like lactoylglutathione lyase family enzyme
MQNSEMKQRGTPLATLAAGITAGVVLWTSPSTAQTTPAGGDLAGPAFFAVSVAELDSSVAWYTRVLGVEPVRFVEGRGGRSRAVVMRRGELVVELISYDGSVGPADIETPTAHRYALQGLVKTGIYVSDAAVWYDHLQTAGVEVDPQVGVDEALEVKTFVFRDRDGNRIQVFAACRGDCTQ